MMRDQIMRLFQIRAGDKRMTYLLLFTYANGVTFRYVYFCWIPNKGKSSKIAVDRRYLHVDLGLSWAGSGLCCIIGWGLLVQSKLGVYYCHCGVHPHYLRCVLVYPELAMDQCTHHISSTCGRGYNLCKITWWPYIYCWQTTECIMGVRVNLTNIWYCDIIANITKRRRKISFT